MTNEEKRNQNSVAVPCGHDTCRGDFTSGVGVQLPDELHDNLQNLGRKSVGYEKRNG